MKLKITPRTKPLLYVAGILAAYLLFTNRQRAARVAEALGTEVRKAVDNLLFKAQMAISKQRYGDLILQVANEQEIDPFLLYGLGDRETLWGTASTYQQQTGDWAPRARSQAQVNKYPGLYKVVGTNADGSLSVMPADGLGWGRGIVQIDWEQAYPWPQNNNWRDDYTNMTKGAQMLKGHLDYFATTPNPLPVSIPDYAATRLGVEAGHFKDPRPVEGTLLVSAALSAYNSGRGQTLWALAAGAAPDFFTTGGDYAQDTLARANTLASNYERALPA